MSSRVFGLSSWRFMGLVAPWYVGSSWTRDQTCVVKVTHSGPALCDPMDYTVRGILQASILEWVAFPFSRGSSQPRGRTQVSDIAGGFFTSWTTREVQEYGFLTTGPPGKSHFPCFNSPGAGRYAPSIDSLLRLPFWTWKLEIPPRFFSSASLSPLWEAGAWVGEFEGGGEGVKSNKFHIIFTLCVPLIGNIYSRQIPRDRGGLEVTRAGKRGELSYS